MASSIITKFAHLQIPLEDVVKATNNFHQDNIIGRGGLGLAYKGQLHRSEELIKIAALRLDRKKGEGDIEFWTEISMLSDLNHTNIVSLIGFCDEKDEKIIITTYAAKGSLKEHLKSPDLTWTQRLKICVGVARALSYLHYDLGRGYGVIHLNINSSTILLDENWEAKVSGFKVSIKQSLNRMDQVFLSEPIGTIGYMDPEIVKTKGVTRKSDVYAFGVVLFEILCGRRAYINNEANRLLAPLAKDHYENEKLHDIIHHDLWNQMSVQSLENYSKLAYSCLTEQRSQRPDTHTIVSELEKALEFQLQRENLVKKMEHLQISLTHIRSSTHDFSNQYKIAAAKGGYALYRAELEHYDDKNPSSKRHNTVLIKRYPSGKHHHYFGEKQFLIEVEILSNVKHPNIVTLLGFCVEASEMILVIENSSNGFLGQCLRNVNNKHVLTWEKRLRICIDVARALNYIHYHMKEQKMIINRDINSNNIVLDDNWGAKIVHFWWSVYIPPNQGDKALYLNRDRTGRKCYRDPQYEMTGNLKRESDVYGFGVVLFEILCGMRAYDPVYLKEGKEGLALVARRNFCMGTLENIIDPIIKEETGENILHSDRGPMKKSLHTFIEIAQKCVAKTHVQRPTMTVVVKELEKALYCQVHSIDRYDEGCSGPAEVVGDVKQLSKKDFIIGKQIEQHDVKLEQQQVGKNLEHLKIPLTNILSATDNFSKKYKVASFSGGYALYRTELEHYDYKNLTSKRHKTIIIKSFPSGHKYYGEKQFVTEIEILTTVKHPNIVTLVGFCHEDSEMILVLEDNFPNGFLGEHLENDSKCVLTWERRLKICIDLAHALQYIHSEIEDQNIIINRDISCYNIGLDKNWGAKIVRFWWSLFLPPNQVDEALYLNNNMGRLCYKDPEYDRTFKLKRESDVYSFGVVLFELLCGRLADDPIYLKESRKGLAFVARRSHITGALEDLIDPIIKEETDENSFLLTRGPNKNSLHTFIEIAHKCVAETQDQRPTMKVVANELEKALFFQKNSRNNPKILLEDIKRATQNFNNDNCIGGGGFGRVYKGNLQDGDGFKTIVAKRLDTSFGQGEQQFLSELQILLDYKHDNIIGLIGYCDEHDEKIIVYEYAPKRSLDRYLNNASLTWVKRLNICIDVASALDFLHGGIGRREKVIHRDIKTANILLNHDWKAKLADFGLSLISPINQETDYVIDHACGTMGYLDPLYNKTGFLTIESDIYSFGVVLFEILCGRSTFAIHKHEGHYLREFIRNRFEEGKHDEVVFEHIREEIMPKSLTTFQEIAYQCLHQERDKRPKTKKVLTELKTALEFQLNSEFKFDYVEEKSHASIIETQVVELSGELNNMNITGKFENFEIYNKEKMLLDQTDDSAESGHCCYNFLAKYLGNNMNEYEKDEEAKVQLLLVVGGLDNRFTFKQYKQQRWRRGSDAMAVAHLDPYAIIYYF